MICPRIEYSVSLYANIIDISIFVIFWYDILSSLVFDNGLVPIRWQDFFIDAYYSASVN